MEEVLLKQILDKLDRLDEKITNFMGFFDLPSKEKAGLKKDVEDYRKGELEVVTLKEAEKLV
jgi:heme oxygenase